MRRRWSFGAGIAAAAIVGFAVRVAYVVCVDPEIRLFTDGGWYHRVANLLADGRGFAHPFVGDGRLPTADFPPVLPLLLALPSWLGLDSVRAHQLVLCGVGTGTVVVVGLLGRRLGGPSVGVVAAFLAALHPGLWQLDGSVMAETPYVLLVALALLAVFALLDAPSLSRWTAVGALCGLAVLTRSDGAVLAPLLMGGAGIALLRRGGRSAARAVLAGGAIATATALAVVAPWAVRNLVVMDAAVLGGNNGGGALAGANCRPAYEGPGLGLWHLGCVVEASDRDPVRLRDETARSAYLRGEGIQYARAHAREVPRVAGIRLLRLWGLYPTAVQLRYEASESRSFETVVVAHRLHLAAAALALAGVVLARRRRVVAWPLLVGALAVSISAVATYGNQRFRAAFEPSMAVLAAVALVAAVERLTSFRTSTGRTGRR